MCQLLVSPTSGPGLSSEDSRLALAYSQALGQPLRTVVTVEKGSWRCAACPKQLKATCVSGPCVAFDIPVPGVNRKRPLPWIFFSWEILLEN